MVNYRLDHSFMVLAHPVRRTIVDRLAHGPAPIGEAAAGVAVSKPAITKHVRVLEEAGIVVRRVEGRTHQLALRAGPLSDAARWLDRYRTMWETKFDVVEQHLAERKHQREREASHDEQQRLQAQPRTPLRRPKRGRVRRVDRP